MARPEVDANGKFILNISNPESEAKIKSGPKAEKEGNEDQKDRGLSDEISNIILPRKPGFR